MSESSSQQSVPFSTTGTRRGRQEFQRRIGWFQFIGKAFTSFNIDFRVGGTANGAGYDEAARKRRQQVKELSCFTSKDAKVVEDTAAEAAKRIESAGASTQLSAQNAGILGLLCAFWLTPILSIVFLPRLPPYHGWMYMPMLIGGVIAITTGAAISLLLVPRSFTGIRSERSYWKKFRIVLGRVIDYAFVVGALLIYGVVAFYAWHVARSHTERGWGWELAFVLAIAPFALIFGMLIAAIVGAMKESRINARQARYVLNDHLILMLLDSALAVKVAVDRWYDPKERARLVRQLESAARDTECSFANAARRVRGRSSAQSIRNLGRQIAAGLRRYEEVAAVAANSDEVRRVQDGISSGILAVAKGDWKAFAHIEPDSVTASVFRRLRPRLWGFLVFGGVAAALVLWSNGTTWSPLAITAAIPLALSALLTLVSPDRNVTERIESVFGKTFGSAPRS
jgi:hypothetical protein